MSRHEQLGTGQRYVATILGVDEESCRSEADASWWRSFWVALAGEAGAGSDSVRQLSDQPASGPGDEGVRQRRAWTPVGRRAERARKVEESHRTEAERLNAELAERVAELQSILSTGLDRPARVDLDMLLRHDELPALDLGEEARSGQRPSWQDFAPREPGVLAGLFGGKARQARRVEEARAAFERAERDYERAEVARQESARQLRARHDDAIRTHQAEVEQHNRRLKALAGGYLERVQESVQAYLEMALAETPLPNGLPRQVEVAYSPRGEQALVRFELPTVEVVPPVASYVYVATTAMMREQARPATEVARLYQSVINQIVLLYMRDVFEADSELENVEVSGHVHAVNSATGQREYPCLISVAVDRATYAGLNLRDVMPEACLRHLNAVVSRHPYSTEAITPIRDFDLARYSFAESAHLVTGMDARADLTKMSPVEFEHFVRRLVEATGLMGWTTERAGDGGVDAVVINRDPVVGGLTVIQAKNYTSVLGVNHIRELVGVMEEKRASRGILVTTSWFDSGSWTEAAENGRVELIDGPRLRYLAQEHLNMDVLVSPPVRRTRTRQSDGGRNA